MQVLVISVRLGQIDSKVNGTCIILPARKPGSIKNGFKIKADSSGKDLW